MKTDIAALMRSALIRILDSKAATFDLPAHISVTRARDPKHGDLTSNVAMTLAKPAGIPPRQLAQLIIHHLPESTWLARAEVAESGFINFHLIRGVAQNVVAEILQQKENFGRCDIGQGKNITVEFFCISPTGPLHIGHGRQAAYSASVAALLEAVGYQVHRTYYVNAVDGLKETLRASMLKDIENDLDEFAVRADEAMGEAPDSIAMRVAQPVVLYRNGEKVNRSTRTNGPVSLRELREEVGNDAARFFFVMAPHNQPLAFDLELAKSSQAENPVFYVQYAHARALRIFRHPDYKNAPWDRENGHRNLSLLTHEKEQALLGQLSRYPEVIQFAAKNRTPHTVVNFLRELTASFHNFYNACRILCDDKDLSDARLSLAKASAQVIHNGLALLGVSAPGKM